MDHQSEDGTWHVDWEEGMCAYDGDDDILIVDDKIHRHPFGTEHTEILTVAEEPATDHKKSL